MEIYPDLEILENNKIRIHNPIYGVPITFLDKYNPEQFEVLGISGDLANTIIIDGHKRSGRFYVNGKRLYDRIVVRKKVNA